MRLILLTVGIALSTIAGADTIRMRVYRQGKEFGTADMTRTLTVTGGKSQELVLTVKGPGNNLVVRQVSRYDRTGRAVFKGITSTVGGRQLSSIAITFTAKGAKAKLEREQGVESKDFPLGKGKTVANPSEYWFILGRPKPGAVVQTYTFPVNALGWEATKTTYLGKGQVTVGKKKVSGHRILSATATRQVETIVDDKGMPLAVIDKRGLSMVRI